MKTIEKTEIEAGREYFIDYFSERDLANKEAGKGYCTSMAIGTVTQVTEEGIKMANGGMIYLPDEVLPWHLIGAVKLIK